MAFDAPGEKRPINTVAQRLAASEVDPNAAFVMRAMDHVNANIKDLRAKDWSAFEAAVAGADVEAQSAIETATRVLKNLKALPTDQEPTLRRAARKLPEIAIALKAMETIGLNREHGSDLSDNPIVRATKFMLDAASNFATDEDKKAAALTSGGIMSDEELAEAKKRVANVKIS